MERIPLESAGPDLQRGVCTPEGEGKTQRGLSASSINREIPGFHLLQHKEFVPLQQWPFSEPGQAATQLHFYEIWGEEEKQH